MKHAFLMACGLAVASASVAVAQTPDEPARVFVSVSGGFQSTSRTITQSGTFQLYDEPGSFTGSRKISSGGLFDIGGGGRVFDKFSAGIAYSRFSKSSSMPLTVIAPHPVFYDTNRTATATVTGLVHTENAVHLQLFYQVLSSPKYDASVFVGPTIFSVKQGAVQAQSVTATEVGPPYTTVNVTAPTVSSSKTAVGANVGLDLNYHVSGGIAAGFFVRYAGATAKMDSGNVKVGGPQMGFGLRYRF